MTRCELRPIPGYPGYHITNDGVVFSDWKAAGLATACSPIHRHRQVLIKTPRGYYRAPLTRDGKQGMQFVHRLVLFAWIGPPPEGQPEVRHIDHDPGNNHVENLAWSSRLENEQDKDRANRRPRRENAWQWKRTPELCKRAIALYAEKRAVLPVALTLGVSRRVIDAVLMEAGLVKFKRSKGSVS